MTESEQNLLDLRIELLEFEVARQKAPKPKESFWSNPVLLAIVGATATAIIGLFTNQSQLTASRQLERDKLESSLILKAVESSDPTQRIAGLQFLVKAGLITDQSHKIESLKSDDVPQIKNSLPKNADSDSSLADLIIQMNAAEKDKRIAAVGQLIKAHGTNVAAVEQAIELLEPPKLDSLSPSGRINVLVFLRNTNEVSWTPESIERTEKAIASIRAQGGTSQKIGNQTDEALSKLSAFLAKLKG